MTTLTLAAALALAAQCGGGLDPNMLVGIAQHESGLNPAAVHDNTDGRSYFPDTSEAGLSLLHALRERGHTSIDVGLAQINTSNFGWLGLTPATALDPCASFRAGAAVLTAFSAYNTGSPTRGITNGYAQATVASISMIRAAGAPVPSTAPAAPPLRTVHLHDQIASFAK
jgi:type IV secretion system protein VirB1